MKKIFLYLMLLSSFLVFGFYNNGVIKHALFGQVVSAEKEHEEEEENNEDHEDDEHYTEEIVTEEIPVEEASPEEVAIPPVSYVWITDLGYDKDTDGDGLVDAIDPNPLIPEPQLFTDTDNDSVPDAHDKKQGEDDFLYLDDSDQNGNGILDSYEQ